LAYLLSSYLTDAVIFTCKVYDLSGYLFPESSVMASLNVTPLIFTKKSIALPD